MSNDRPRNTQGQYEPKHNDEEFLEAVREHAPAGTQEVADAVGITRPSAIYRLEKLEDAGKVQRKKIGARAVVWWITDSEEVTTDIDSDNPLFTGEPILTPEDPVDETEIDNVLYNEIDK